MRRISFYTFVLFISLFAQAIFTQASAQASYPSCESAGSDTDGDGWGWEFNRSCKVDQTSPVAQQCVDTDGDGYGWNGVETCEVSGGPSTNGQPVGTSICIDTDGDGWGWDGQRTCIPDDNPGPTSQTSPGECIDVDGDGWGWDGLKTCTPNGGSVGGGGSTSGGSSSGSGSATAGACIDDNNDGWGWNGVTSCQVGRVPPVPPPTTTNVVSGVTDVVLMMGQSNALGHNTKVDRNGLDAVDQNVIVWTEFDGWQVADLCSQIWQSGWFPWRGGMCSNHPAFQIAKSIVERDPSRKVAIIPTGIAGKPISWWDDGAIAYVLAKAHTEAALAALPGNNQVDLVAWSQGEADHGAEDYWFSKLNNLFSRLRSESYVDPQSTVFIAQETKKSSVNSKLPSFDNDADTLTGWIRASDLATKDGVHWSGAALRSLGDRYATEYLRIVNL